MGHIQRHHLHEALVVVPSGMLLSAADRLIAPLLARIVHNNVESRCLGEIRDTLLPKLMSGQIRLDIPAKKVEARA